MKKLATVIGGIAMTIMSILLIAPFATLMGAIAGWMVGVFFGDDILSLANQIGILDVTMWKLGAFLGFVGSFLKTKVTATVTAMDHDA